MNKTSEEKESRLAKKRQRDTRPAELEEDKSLVLKPGLAGESSRIQNIRSREMLEQRDHRKGRDRSAHASKRNTESASKRNQRQVVDRARAQRRQDQETSPEIC